MVLDDPESSIDALIKSQQLKAEARKLSPVPTNEHTILNTNTNLSGVSTKQKKSQKNIVPKENENDIYRRCIHQFSILSGILFFNFHISCDNNSNYA